MATTPAEKVMAGGGDNSVFVVINLMLTCYLLKDQLEDAIIDGGIAVKFQLLPWSSELGKSDKLSSDK